MNYVDMAQNEPGRFFYERCEELANSSNIFKRLDTALHGCGLIGERPNAYLIYLAAVTRLFPKPVSFIIKGSSGAGKSNLLNTLLRFLYPRSYYSLSGASEKAIIRTNESLQNRMLVIQELAGLGGDDGLRFIRQLLSEGKIKYETVDQISEPNGTLVFETVGPTNLAITSTTLKIHPEDESRLLSLVLDESPERMKEVLVSKALRSETTDSQEPDFEEWLAFDQWLTRHDSEVVIPYAKHVAELIQAHDHRVKRDFDHAVSLVKAHALIHQLNRNTGENGEIIASLSDYAFVREILEPVLSRGLVQTVDPKVREIINSVRGTMEAIGGHSVSQADLTAHFERSDELSTIDKSTVSRHVKEALKTPYLENLQVDKGKSHKLVLGEPLPEDSQVLPTVDEVRSSISIREV